jgi:hypothetical protein
VSCFVTVKLWPATPGMRNRANTFKLTHYPIGCFPAA